MTAVQSWKIERDSVPKPLVAEALGGENERVERYLLYLKEQRITSPHSIKQLSNV